MAKIKRSNKRADQLSALSNGKDDTSAIKQLSDKINEFKTENIILSPYETRLLINLYAEAAI